MRMSRRNFLVAAAGSAALSQVPKCLSWASSPVRANSVVILETASPLRESLAGYEAALSGGGIPFTRTRLSRGVLRSCRAIIVPGCVTLPPEVAEQVARLVRAGSLLLLESGAGFSSRTEFEAHRDFLRAHFRLAVRPALDLWEDDESRSRVPYVDYRWPHAAKIRDFSRAVPLAVRDERAIACIGPQVVASKQRYGRGTLLFLGSPLGPALWAGDAEAHDWFRRVITPS